MPEIIDKHQPADPIKQELENTAIPPPDWALDHAHHDNSGETGVKAIPQSFLDAILEVIAKTIEKVLAEVVSRVVGESIERRIIPLTEQVTLLRTAVYHAWDENHRRREQQEALEKKKAEEEKESQP
jgi:hypothetical protein